MFKRAIPMLLAAALLTATPTLAYAAAQENPSGEANGAKVSYSENSSSPGGEVVSVLSAGGQEPASAGSGYYPTEIKTVEEDGEKLIIKTYKVPAEVEASRLVEDTVEKNGVKYEMREILKDTLPGGEETKLASKTVTIESKSDKEAEIRKLLDPLIDFSEDGFSGQLSLDSFDTEVERTEPYYYTVTETRQMAGMDRNDTYYIPKTACKNGVELTLCDVDWTTMGCGASDGRVMPNQFAATAKYTGRAVGSRPTGYTVVATYTGEVRRPTPGDVVYSIVYGRAADQPLELAVGEKEWGGTPFFIIGFVLLLGGAGVGVWYFFKHKGPRPPKGKTRIYMPREMEPAAETGGETDV